ncbi:MAG: 5-(carboxyamino)imidazole ribonucleotide synthase [Candidatus Pelagibacterales bacterium]|jgi:5-(carboxyamino)imidazole ribonucleotide synthase|tara:strand:- start:1033 stop:2103 length:1071 start_codon:yes stop_codon:yes gene_type:complete
MNKKIKVGIIGGGQLGMMLAEAASKLGIVPFIYSNTKDSPAAKVAKTYYGNFDDVTKIKKFINKVDLVTYEFENIPTTVLSLINKTVPIFPPIKALKITQDRIKEKKFFIDNKISCVKTQILRNTNDLKNIRKQLSYPSVIKTARLGYDGKGQFTVNSYAELLDGWNRLDKTSCVVEKKINIAKEISIIGARSVKGEIEIFPSFRNIHKNHILDITKLPSCINKDIEKKANEVTLKILKKLNYVGILCVEFFIDDTGSLMANEMAPRVHNSGHITIEACITSQFEQHLRAIVDLPLGSTKIIKPAVMKNLIGDDISKIRMIKSKKQFSDFKKSKLHNYFKKDIKPGRKMAHITFYN